jgi:glycosyltransferase involved in cell wall biosynthesis
MNISAVIPSYNRRKYVTRAIESILAQSVPVDEIIVVDDGSTDGTAEEIASRFGDRVRVVQQANQGVSAARRRGILEAKGEWIAFLDSDDEWTPDRNRIFRHAIETVPAEVAWIFGDLEKVTDGGDETTQFQQHGLRVDEAVHVFDDPLSVQHPIQFGLLQGSVIKRKVLLELGCFSEGFRKGEDILAEYQVACRYGLAAVPDVVTKFYRTSDLAESSLTTDSSAHADYYRARMEAFSLAVRMGRRHPWGKLYEQEVRGMCRELGKKGQTCRRLSLEQFRYGVSSKSIAFFCAAMLGQAGLGFWSKAASMGRAVPAYLRSSR